MAKNINVVKTMNEYAEELKGIVTERKQPEVDPLWDTWYEEAYRYEPQPEVCIVVDTSASMPVTTIGTFLTKQELNELSEAVCEMVEDMPLVRKDRTTRANRRRQKFYHRMKQQRNAEAIQNGYVKRMEEDMKNGSFCKKRGGGKVNNPKSLSMKSDAILERALKMEMDVEPVRAEKTVDVTEEALKIWSNFCDENKLTNCKMYNGRKVVGNRSTKILAKAVAEGALPDAIEKEIIEYLEMAA